MEAESSIQQVSVYMKGGNSPLQRVVLMFGDWKEWRLKEKWQLYKPEETGVGRR
jgi:hypothetical protein